MFTKFEKKLLFIILLLTLAIFSLLMGTLFATVYENKYWLLVAGSFTMLSIITLARSLSWFSKMNRDNRIVLKDD